MFPNGFSGFDNDSSSSSDEYYSTPDKHFNKRLRGSVDTKIDYKAAERRQKWKRFLERLEKLPTSESIPIDDIPIPTNATSSSADKGEALNKRIRRLSIHESESNSSSADGDAVLKENPRKRSMCESDSKCASTDKGAVLSDGAGSFEGTTSTSSGGVVSNNKFESVFRREPERYASEDKGVVVKYRNRKLSTPGYSSLPCQVILSDITNSSSVRRSNQSSPSSNLLGSGVVKGCGSNEADKGHTTGNLSSNIDDEFTMVDKKCRYSIDELISGLKRLQKKFPPVAKDGSSSSINSGSDVACEAAKGSTTGNPLVSDVVREIINSFSCDPSESDEGSTTGSLLNSDDELLRQQENILRIQKRIRFAFRRMRDLKDQDQGQDLSNSDEEMDESSIKWMDRRLHKLRKSSETTGDDTLLELVIESNRDRDRERAHDDDTREYINNSYRRSTEAKKDSTTGNHLNAILNDITSSGGDVCCESTEADKGSTTGNLLNRDDAVLNHSARSYKARHARSYRARQATSYRARQATSSRVRRSNKSHQSSTNSNSLVCNVVREIINWCSCGSSESTTGSLSNTDDDENEGSISTDESTSDPVNSKMNQFASVGCNIDYECCHHSKKKFICMECKNELICCHRRLGYQTEVKFSDSDFINGITSESDKVCRDCILDCYDLEAIRHFVEEVLKSKFYDMQVAREKARLLGCKYAYYNRKFIAEAHRVCIHIGKGPMMAYFLSHKADLSMAEIKSLIEIENGNKLGKYLHGKLQAEKHGLDIRTAHLAFEEEWNYLSYCELIEDQYLVAYCTDLGNTINHQLSKNSVPNLSE